MALPTPRTTARSTLGARWRQRIKADAPSGATTHGAAKDVVPTPLCAPSCFRVLMAFVHVRESASTSAPIIARRFIGEVFEVDDERSGWVRTAERFDGAPGWLLIDGSELGLGPLLERLEPGSASLVALASQPPGASRAERIRTYAPRPAAATGPLCKLRVALITSANLFVYDGNRISTQYGLRTLEHKPRYETRQTGGMLATLNLVRYLHGHVALEVLALETLDEAFKGDAAIMAVEMWEGRQILRGSYESLVAHARGGSYDMAIAGLLDTRLVKLAQEVAARRTAAMVHDHHQVPWGPWASLASSPPGGQRAAGWAETVGRLDALLCTSVDVANYARRHRTTRPAPAALPCPATDYHHGSADPTRALPIDLPTLRPWDNTYVTMVSPCAMKGLGVLLRLAHELPEVSFLAVQTGWTKPADLVALDRLATHRNIKVTPACPEFATLLAETKVLLVPSLWREGYGLVALEAALRGIPVLSTDHGGLVEANPIAEFRFPSRLVADHERKLVSVGLSLEEYEATRPQLDISFEAVVEAAATTTAAATAQSDAAFGESGWYGMAPADVAPVPSFKAALRRLCGEEVYLRTMSAEAARRSREYATSREFGLSRSLEQLL